MSARKFTLFHLSLMPIRQPNFSTRVDLDREGWLRLALDEHFVFSHRSNRELHWVSRDGIDEFIFGVIQQEKQHVRHEPPQRGGAELQIDEWQGAYLLLDPTTHSDGQKLAVENDMVGQPHTLVKYLLRHINSRDDRPFEIEAEQIFDGSDFWEFAKNHDNILRSVTFEFVVPNMWSTESDLEKDLEETRDETGAEKVKVAFASKNGVTATSSKIRDGVDYAERGGGKITAHSLDGKPFSSEQKPKVTEIPTVDVEKESVASVIREFSRRILGREKGASLASIESTERNSTTD